MPQVSDARKVRIAVWVIIASIAALTVLHFAGGTVARGGRSLLRLVRWQTSSSASVVLHASCSGNGGFVLSSKAGSQIGAAASVEVRLSDIEQGSGPFESRTNELVIGEVTPHDATDEQCMVAIADRPRLVNSVFDAILSDAPCSSIMDLRGPGNLQAPLDPSIGKVRFYGESPRRSWWVGSWLVQSR